MNGLVEVGVAVAVAVGVGVGVEREPAWKVAMSPVHPTDDERVAAYV